MRIFVTGASGWIGFPTVGNLIRAGHDVVGLARSDQAAEVIRGLGGEAVRGTLDHIEYGDYPQERYNGDNLMPMRTHG